MNVSNTNGSSELGLSSQYYVGAIVRLGRNHVFRFNHPREAARLREEMKGVSALVLGVVLPFG